jgi:hypothetical protein
MMGVLRSGRPSLTMQHLKTTSTFRTQNLKLLGRIQYFHMVGHSENIHLVAQFGKP